MKFFIFFIEESSMKSSGEWAQKGQNKALLKRLTAFQQPLSHLHKHCVYQSRASITHISTADDRLKSTKISRNASNDNKHVKGVLSHKAEHCSVNEDTLHKIHSLLKSQFSTESVPSCDNKL